MPLPFRVAVIGLGDVAVRRHLPILLNHPHFQLVSAAELDATRAQRVASQFSIPNLSADPRAVIESDAVDVVAILTPPFTHAALAHLALEAGKHVFIEKPLTLDVGEAEEITAHAERAQAKFFTAFNQRHHPVLQGARDMLREGQLGTLRVASAFLSNIYKREVLSAWHSDPTRGDLLFDLGVHHFDALRFLTGAEAVEISAQEAITPDNAITLTTQMQLSNGMLVTTTLAEDTLEHNELRIVGDRGKLDLSLYRFDGLRLLPRGVYDGSFGLRFADMGKTLTALPSAVSRMRQGGDYTLTYRAEWDHFYEVLQNNVPPLATARDGLQATQIASAARRSITERARVKV